MDKIGEVFSKYPWLVVGIVGAVAFVAWRQSANGPPVDVMSGGGVTSIPVDAGTVAIETNRQNTGTENLRTLSELILGRSQSSDALTSSLAQTSAAKDTSLAQTSAARDVGLAETASQTTIAQAAAAANAAMNAATNAANIERSRIEAAAQTATTNSNNQTTKDTSRAQDNTQIVDTIVSVAGRIIGWFF